MTTTKHIEYKSANSSGVAQVLANKGICWQVQDDEGEIFLVQKKHVVRGPWEETDEEAAPPAAGSVAAQILAAAAKAEPKARVKKEPAVTDPDLCFDLGMEPRIARRSCVSPWVISALAPAGSGSWAALSWLQSGRH